MILRHFLLPVALWAWISVCKDFIVTSDGQRIANPRHLQRKARNLARYQRRLARTQRGSRNRAKARRRIAAAHRKVRNRRMARAISDVAWGEFRTMLEYKAHRAGRTLLVVDRWYPSTKTCSSCGHLLAELGLSIRHWTCPNCRIRHDRDLNAAKYILAAGRAVARGDLGDACGADVRRQGFALPQSAAKQEPCVVRHTVRCPT
ncbi:RNA-guided endonuclease TnpB family protein [Lentzea sp. BCCO 10_0856]|uniref:RNA-guided endonuclease TnpB family protein n=1 Tax=Lentzea miocenica TaxID=3095431 RepID=A0ABU4SZV6_9PSEU|nr:RNA-guided endonuclease TnpB family protein [Lentzea sp. BCCO 10_0856]MDX8031443.1 RNA-guided endonuclease TnpB family protein [Lentzea sp. BCCO 10_0856]